MNSARSISKNDSHDTARVAVHITVRAAGHGAWRLLSGLWIHRVAAMILFCSATGVVANDVEIPSEEPQASGSTEFAITAADLEHWSFRQLSRPDVPPLRATADAHNPIDSFNLHDIHAAGLIPLPAASDHALVRRLHFDLIGLPPAPDDLASFVHDTAPDKWPRLIDRLLASPAYGERWAQHWLDLARFAETDGFEHDKVRPNAWKFRDWTILALNADLPYDQFLRLQIAGDHVAPASPDARIATGFLLCGPDMPDINSQDERRHNYLNDLTSTVASSILGLQFGCAQCHDHKYDPISQADFYRLRAFFENTELFHEKPIPTRDETAQRRQFEVQRSSQWKSLTAKLADLNRLAAAKTSDNDGTTQPDSGLTVQQVADRKRWTAELNSLKKRELPSLPLGRVVAELEPNKYQPRLWIRGDFRRPGDPVQPEFPRIINASLTTVSQAASQAASQATTRNPSESADSLSMKPRQQLAAWITRNDNPMTRRVIANRIWQHHFGRGLSASESDFGIMGQEPTHPELLDWLATELNRRDWSVKAIHRAILTSATWRRTSRPRNNADDHWKTVVTTDPDNRLLARMPRQRLDGETLRDAMLAVSGNLNRRQYGPGFRPPLPAEIVGTLLNNQWRVTPNAAEHQRRSIYLFVRRNLRFPMFEAFDRPDMNLSCARRDRSTTAPQSLILLNSEFSYEIAEQLAVAIRNLHPDDPEAAIGECFRRALAREPSTSETQLAREFMNSISPAALNDQSGRSATTIDNSELIRLTALCLGVLNLNEFIYID